MLHTEEIPAKDITSEILTEPVLPTPAEIQSAYTREEKIALLKKFIMFAISIGVFLPVLSSSEECAIDEDCGGLIGPLNNELIFKTFGSIHYLVASALYSFLEGHHALDTFWNASLLQKCFILFLVAPALCAQEFIFALAQGTSGGKLVASVTGAFSGAFFAAEQLKKIMISQPMQKFKWKILLGSPFMMAKTAEEKEMLYYGFLHLHFIQILQGNFQRLVRKVKSNQLSENIPKDPKDYISFLLKTEIPIIFESKSARYCRRSGKIILGFGLLSGLSLTPNLTNTFIFLCEKIGTKYGLFFLNIFLTTFMLTKNTYSMLAFFSKTVGGTIKEIQNWLNGKDSELLIYQLRKKTTITAFVLISIATIWTYQTQYGLIKNSLADENYQLRLSMLLSAVLAHNMTDNMSVHELSSLSYNAQESFLKKLDKEITKWEAMNFQQFRAAIQEILDLETPYLKNHGISKYNAIDSKTEASVPLVPTPTKNAIPPEPSKPHVSLSWCQRLSIWCCQKKPNPNTQATEQIYQALTHD